LLPFRQLVLRKLTNRLYANNNSDKAVFMNKAAEIRYFCGVDGGGTRCRARIRAANGALIGEGNGGRANLYASIDDSHRSVLEAIFAALAAGKLDAGSLPLMGCGLALAGASVPGAADALIARLPFAQSIVFTDGAAALAGAFEGREGAIAILGTGAAYMARRNGMLREIGGWGFHAGDQGSGADLGRMILRRTLLAHDGVMAHSPLTNAVLGDFEHDPLALLAFARDATPGEYGRYAPAVFDALDAGDDHAKAIVHEALVVIRASIAAIAEGVDRLCLLGGLAKRYQPLLEPEFGALLKEPLADAMDGAILLFRQPQGDQA
jgi:glucosamine kinase